MDDVDPTQTRVRLVGGPYDGVTISSPRTLGSTITLAEDLGGWEVDVVYLRDPASGEYRCQPGGRRAGREATAVVSAGGGGGSPSPMGVQVVTLGGQGGRGAVWPGR